MVSNPLIPNYNASKLDLSNRSLKVFPVELFKCKNLKKLNLSNNQITSIPKEISKLSKLENLDLSGNSIRILYSKVFELKKLKTLIINNNLLKKIPKQVGNLRELEILSFAGNEITEFPPEVAKLATLKKLSIANNPISTFPPEIFELTNLDTLWINNNIYNTLPASEIVRNLKNLRAIYCYSISRNRMDQLDSTYLLLARKKGNSIHHLKILAQKDISSLRKIVGVSNPANTKDLQKDYIKADMSTTNNENLVSLKKRNKIFISYSHKDKVWLDRINTFLKSMLYNGLDIEVWDDTKIKTSQKWKEEIANALAESHIAILIISIDFLASDFIRSNELPHILERAQLGETKVISLIVRPCTFDRHEVLSQFQSVNPPSNPLSGMSDYDIENYLVKLTYDVEEAIR